MFGWVRKLFGRGGENNGRRPYLFRFYDGTQWREADPFLIWRRLFTHPKMNFDTMVPLASAGQEPEATIVLEALCEVFGVKQFDESTGGGLTGWELLELIGQFEQYLAALKKNTSPGRMPLLLSALGYSTSPEPQSEPENCSLDCGQTPAESVSAEVQS